MPKKHLELLFAAATDHSADDLHLVKVQDVNKQSPIMLSAEILSLLQREGYTVEQLWPR